MGNGHSRKFRVNQIALVLMRLNSSLNDVFVFGNHNPDWYNNKILSKNRVHVLNNTWFKYSSITKVIKCIFVPKYLRSVHY